MREVNTHKPGVQAQVMELSKGNPVLGNSLGSGACLLGNPREHTRRRVNHMGCKGQTKVFERMDLCKLDPCYSKYTLAIKQNDFRFIGIYFKAI